MFLQYTPVIDCMHVCGILDGPAARILQTEAFLLQFFKKFASHCDEQSLEDCPVP
jgi:hypothetical protein